MKTNRVACLQLHNNEKRLCVLAVVVREWKRIAVIMLSLFIPFITSAAHAQAALTQWRVVIGDSASAVQLAQPLGMSLDAEGNIYVADTGQQRVLKCNPEGKLLREVGGFGFGEQQFDRPVAIWVDNSLNVFVADYNNQRVQRYDKDLNFISSYAADAVLAEQLRFGYPAALAVSAQGEMFVADHEYNRVLRFDALGSPAASFGDFNWGEGRLQRPAKIYISRQGEIWVSDSLQHALMQYDAFGNFVGEIQLERNEVPSGIAEWEHGIIVAERQQHALILFAATGERIGRIGRRGHAALAFEAPAEVINLRAEAHGTEGLTRLLILDSGNNRVVRVELQWQH